MISNKNLLLFLAIILAACNPNKELNYIQFINQRIGTNVSTIKAASGDLQTDPVPGQTIIGVSAPFGMTQWTPQLQSGQQKCVAPYYYGSIYTEGFRATHWLNGSCEKDYGSFAILPTTLADEFKFLPNRRQNLSLYSFEDLSPAYMSVGFPNEQLVTEVTGTERCGFFRFSWLSPTDPVIMISINNDYDQGYIEIDLEKQEISGYNPVSQFYRNKGESAGIAGYFVAKFDQKFVKYGTYGNFDIEHGSTIRSDQRQIGAYVSFQPQNDIPVLLKVGTSFTSIENARKNLETEINDWDFSGTKMRTEQVWNELLGKIEIESKDTTELTKFYTSLYRSLQHPRLMNDVNGDYPVFGKKTEVKNTRDFNYYDDFLSWNISRAQMPLLSLIAPEQYQDMIQSLLLKAKDGGWLPESPLTNNYTMAGTGDFCSSIIVDAAIKGFDFDYNLAYEYLQKNALAIPTDSEIQNGQGRPGLESYIQNGFIPLDEQLLDAPQAESQVARTLEYAYNDWCVAQLAGKLGRKQDFENLSLRALNYTNVFDESMGWMNGRYTDGSFFEEFNLDQNQSFIADKSTHQYSWYVPHDVAGLIELMGGIESFSQKLTIFLNSSAYAHADANNQHIPYLFNYVNEWGETQKAVKKILQEQYGSSIGGLAGHENAGQLSAWYVLSSLGFYPTSPGSNEYQMSSPIFDKATLHLDKKYYPGQKLILIGSSDAQTAIYSEIKLNGKKIGTSITQEDLKQGGILEFLKSTK